MTFRLWAVFVAASPGEVFEFLLARYVEIGVSVGTRVAAGLLAGVAIGTVVGIVVRRAVGAAAASDSGDPVPSHPTRGTVTFWSAGAASIALFTGWDTPVVSLTPLVRAGIFATIAAAIVVVAQWSRRLPNVPPPGEVGAWLGRLLDDLEYVLVLAIGYHAVTGGLWVVSQVLLLGAVTAADRDAVAPAVERFASLLVLPWEVVFWCIAGPGIAFAVSLRLASSDRVCDRIAEIRDEAERRKLEAFETRFERRSAAIEGGVFFAFLILVVLVGDWIAAANAYVLAVVGEVLIVLYAAWVIVQIERADFARTTIEKSIKRAIGPMAISLVVFSVAAVLAVRYFDRFVDIYTTQLLPNATAVFTPEHLRLYAGREVTPDRLLDVFAQAEYAQWDDAAHWALSVVLPVVALLATTPIIVVHLYYHRVRSVIRVAGTYVGFLLLTLGIDLGVSGGFVRAGEVGALAVFPTVIATFVGEIAHWFKEQIGYVDCPTCDEQVEADSRFCPYCKSSL